MRLAGSLYRFISEQMYDKTTLTIRHDRKVEGDVPAFNRDVIRQATEPELAEPRPQ